MLVFDIFSTQLTHKSCRWQFEGAKMSRRKGVSLEEKRQRILHIYHDSKDVFNLKEVEKLASKAGVGGCLQPFRPVCRSLTEWS